MTWPLHLWLCALPLSSLGGLRFLILGPAAPVCLSMHAILLKWHLSASGLT